MIGRVATWWTILRISLEERLVYRGDFALGTLMRFLPIITQIFLWLAVFNDAARGRILLLASSPPLPNSPITTGRDGLLKCSRTS